MNETYKIRRIGGALLVTIPQHIVHVMELTAGDKVTIEHDTIGRKRGAITIRPAPQPKNGKRK